MATIRSRNYLLRPGMIPSEAVVVNDRVAAIFRLPSGAETWELIDDLVDVDWTETAALTVSTKSPRELPGWVTPVEAALGIPDLFQAMPEERVEVGLLVLVRCELPPLEEGGEEPGQARFQWLIWSFGSGFANFVRDKFVPDYGVRSVLNAAARIAEDNGVAPSLKAVHFVIGGATRQRAAHTAMESLQPDEFRMNTIADLLAGAGVSGHPLAGSVEGTVGLVGSFDLTAMDQIQDLSTHLVRQYEDDIYEQAFSFYAHRRPVMDIFLEADLYEDLYNALVAEDVRVSCQLPPFDERTRDVAYLAFPNEHANNVETTEPNRHKLAIEALQYGGVAFFDATIRFLDAGRQPVTQRPAKDLLYAELEKDEGSYVFSDGVWYRVETDYLEGLRARIAQLRADPSDDWPEYTKETEPDWLAKCAALPQSLLVLDKQLIHVENETPVEPADLIDRDGRLIYVKRRRSSSKTTYVFDQASSALTVLARSPSARERLLEMLDENTGAADDVVLDAARNTIAEIAAGNPIEVLVVLLGSGGSSNPATLPLNTKVATDEATKELASVRATLRISHWGIGMDND